MSRIGNLPISLPDGVTVDIKSNMIVVKGPKGELSQDIDSSISVNQDGNFLILSRSNDSKQSKSYHGLYRSLISNMVEGVSKGFSKNLEIQGVGYRAELKDNYLILNLGYSSPVWYEIEDGIDIKLDGQTKIIISGISKERVGQVSSEIRSIRAPEPYKGKGIRYSDEYVRRKVGKSGVK